MPDVLDGWSHRDGARSKLRSTLRGRLLRKGKDHHTDRDWFYLVIAIQSRLKETGEDPKLSRSAGNVKWEPRVVV
jgi:hypothetical protein